MTATSRFELSVLTWRVAMTVCAGLAMEGMAESVLVCLYPLQGYMDNPHSHTSVLYIRLFVHTPRY